MQDRRISLADGDQRIVTMSSCVIEVHSLTYLLTCLLTYDCAAVLRRPSGRWTDERERGGKSQSARRYRLPADGGDQQRSGGRHRTAGLRLRGDETSTVHVRSGRPERRLQRRHSPRFHHRRWNHGVVQTEPKRGDRRLRCGGRHPLRRLLGLTTAVHRRLRK